jgi:putative DNA primase/helicase
VLPDECIRCTTAEEVMLQTSGAIEHSFRCKGTLCEWQDAIARYAIGNSRLAFALSAAFGAALVNPCDAESGGLHFRGASSMGKTTALEVAGSVWGGGEPGGYWRSWRATSNGLEGVALGHCDTLLCLDEIAQITARDAGEVAYMLANGSGKSRSARDGSGRRAARWRLLFLSSGEIGLAEKLSEDGRGRQLSAGQQVRIVDIPADAGAGLGIFEE